LNNNNFFEPTYYQFQHNFMANVESYIPFSVDDMQEHIVKI